MVDRIRCALIVLVLLAVGFVTAGVLLLVLGDSTIDKIVKKECQLKQGTMLFETWLDSPVPFYISIYVFDLLDTNFLNGTSKPNFRQRGPFVYREQRSKFDIREYENETISYRETRSYVFDPSRSAESETVNITTVNIVYMTLINFLQQRQVPGIFQRIVAELLSSREKPIMQRTVKEFLWGYEDPLLHTLQGEFPDLVTSDNVSAFYASVSQAGSNVFLINNGAGFDSNHDERIDHVGIIERFNFDTHLPYWSDKYANMINGTDSTLWHPDATTTEQVNVFISDICRSLHLNYNETRINNFNIQTYHYTAPDSIFENSSDNEGFCMNVTYANKTSVLECLPSGLFSLETCIHLSGTSVTIPLPIIGSTPHFLGADPSVQNAVKGLSPDDGRHRSFVDIEPRTGIVMNGSRRLQINMNVINDSSISPVALLNPVVFPLLWVDEHAEIDQPSAKKFHHKVTSPIAAINAMKYTFIGIGAALFMVAIGLFIYKRYKRYIFGQPFDEKANDDEASPLLF